MRFGNWLKRLYQRYCSQLKRKAHTAIQILCKEQKNKNERTTKTNCQTNRVNEWRRMEVEKNKPNHKTLFEWFQPENMNETLTSVLNAFSMLLLNTLSITPSPTFSTISNSLCCNKENYEWRSDMNKMLNKSRIEFVIQIVLDAWCMVWIASFAGIWYADYPGW